ncbi:hypothetical protein AMELA_G00281130 [Ameiurus melas]|uniref:Uncharacterized protein n=1 Tax=Ameiurus melas TaxID=219545 RepID=A0A7J5ZMI0_AMEME|nr:hypothetical protein AMELA_G00281130 [Ameiurus melas]
MSRNLKSRSAVTLLSGCDRERRAAVCVHAKSTLLRVGSVFCVTPLLSPEPEDINTRRRRRTTRRRHCGVNRESCLRDDKPLSRLQHN